MTSETEGRDKIEQKLSELGNHTKLNLEFHNAFLSFEDTLLFDDRSVQKILREVHQEDMAIALKIASDELKEKIFSALEEDLDDFVFRFDKRDTYLALDFLRAVVDGDYDEQYAYMKHLVASSGGSKVTKLCHEILAVGCSCIVEYVNSTQLVFFLSAPETRNRCHGRPF
ncbi:FliG C-terminal domain-containing protein [uncultured Treponema sp.]|uniref:FliG C-terminal domain-containing protein n=1 Tax=uncultured Treponema sp. TaxID=162155 RepID=UPI0025F7E2C9|nr:FliG C-terminal domain-containing protein [uncultured Treponema sp.]